ncbi:MAG TPA: hypothetical protein P5057_10110, partial [Acidobacteriota bacterium]|nr:hypothetical protein [Acidobacteriota bacterium]
TRYDVQRWDRRSPRLRPAVGGPTIRLARRDDRFTGPAISPRTESDNTRDREHATQYAVPGTRIAPVYSPPELS